MLEKALARVPIYFSIIIIALLFAGVAGTGVRSIDMSLDQLVETRKRWDGFVAGPSSRLMILGEAQEKMGIQGMAQALGAWSESRTEMNADIVAGLIDAVLGDLEIYFYLEPSSEELLKLERLTTGLGELKALIRNNPGAEELENELNLLRAGLDELNAELQRSYKTVTDAMTADSMRLADGLEVARAVLLGASLIGVVLMATFLMAGVARPLMRMAAALAAGSRDVSQPAMLSVQGFRELQLFVRAYNAQIQMRASAERKAYEERLAQDAKLREESDLARKSAMQEISAQIQAELEGLIKHVTESGSAVHRRSDAVRTRLDAQKSAVTGLQDGIGNVEGTVGDLSARAQSLVVKIADNQQRVQQSLEKSDGAFRSIADSKALNSELQQLTERLSSVIDLIKSVTHQTNSLSINASIEAARAGPAGLGFAVVAQEVGDLSKRAAAAADEVEAQIAGVRSVGERCGVLFDDLAGNLQDILAFNQEFKGDLSEQHDAGQAMLEGCGDVGATTQQMHHHVDNADRIVGDVTTETEHLFETAAEIKDNSRTMKEKWQTLLARLEAA